MGKAPKEGSPWYENSKYPEKGTQKKGKDPSEKNNPRQDSSQKIRVKKKKKKTQRKKKKRENVVGIVACINRPSFPSLLANSLFEVSKSNSQQPFRPILQNEQLLWQEPMPRLFKLEFGFHLGLLILWANSILNFDCKYI